MIFKQEMIDLPVHAATVTAYGVGGWTHKSVHLYLCSAALLPKPTAVFLFAVGTVDLQATEEKCVFHDVY